jgi:hypothetical protein
LRKFRNVEHDDEEVIIIIIIKDFNESLSQMFSILICVKCEKFSKFHLVACWKANVILTNSKTKAPLELSRVCVWIGFEWRRQDEGSGTDLKINNLTSHFDCENVYFRHLCQLCLRFISITYVYIIWGRIERHLNTCKKFLCVW